MCAFVVAYRTGLLSFKTETEHSKSDYTHRENRRRGAGPCRPDAAAAHSVSGANSIIVHHSSMAAYLNYYRAHTKHSVYVRESRPGKVVRVSDFAKTHRVTGKQNGRNRLTPPKTITIDLGHI